MEYLPQCPGCGMAVFPDEISWADGDETWHIDCFLETESVATIIAALPE
jgi:hypothetical protein